MERTLARRMALPILFALVALTTACSTGGGTPPAGGSDPAGSDPPAAAEPTTDTDAGDDMGAMFGCTDGMLAHLADNGYADVPPVDPAGFTFPDDVTIAASPTCLVTEDDGSGVARSSAIFTSDPEGVIVQANDAFLLHGWTGDPDVGLWWSDGPDAAEAAYSVGGGLFEIDGQQTAWFTWGY